ncbi:hypothetical protein QP168_03665 [Aerococcus urinae]|uniref:Uncharacterized protein n=1 Tax=Aerococcus mictus TaxID=2976810 RepID=A0A1E9PFU1_9LACT|nr:MULTISPECIES: hypothetical protein [Aerococcus]KAA9292210.1 hypothetical protein F6I06_04130 [Aerococcus mictus]MBU5609472.1 hypothetical protein [Aerococcus urinae]MCY3033491.1 hypothetical protein [Aerococcus mictus]MCY3064358.1 hypothetical protein [Aerococcus mictus]MCY3065294.1 hypothetical protein [Aerococcus mictus]
MALFDKNDEKKYEEIVEDFDLEGLNKDDLKVLLNNSNEAASGGVSALVVQNYIIMRQLDRLNKNIEQLMKK